MAVEFPSGMVTFWSRISKVWTLLWEEHGMLGAVAFATSRWATRSSRTAAVLDA